MEKNKIIIMFILFLSIFAFFSGSNKKESFENRFYVYICNYSDYDTELEFVFWNKNKLNSIKKIVNKKSYRMDCYKKMLKKFSDKVTVRIKINEDEKIEKIISFPNNGIFSYSAYGGLCTRININYIKSTPSINFSNDWEPELLLQQME